MERQEQDAMINAYAWLVRACAVRLGAQNDDDALQCGLIGLWEACRAWDGKRSFVPMARRCTAPRRAYRRRGRGAQVGRRGVLGVCTEPMHLAGVPHARPDPPAWAEQDRRRPQDRMLPEDRTEAVQECVSKAVDLTDGRKRTKSGLLLW